MAFSYICLSWDEKKQNTLQTSWILYILKRPSYFRSRYIHYNVLVFNVSNEAHCMFS